MKKPTKILLTVLSAAFVISSIFWEGVYYIEGLSHLYYSQNVVKSVYKFLAVAAVILALFSLVAVMLFKGKKVVRVISAVILAVLIPAGFLASFVGMASVGILGSNGCSYTEDIANYGKYDEDYSFDHFPDKISPDMTVVDFSYYYKYVDINHIDVYLEVEFDDKETMDKYLNEAINSFSETGYLSYQNPYNPGYTDIVEDDWVLHSSETDFCASYINFDGDEEYKCVGMEYSSVTYSYDELTVIYNHTSIGSDIEVGDNPDEGEYYPKYLKRFGVEWNPKNNFSYECAEK